MKNIITAIGNINLNNELKKDEYFGVLSQDIQYQDGIFEILEQKNEIDFLVVSQNISGQFDFIELITNIIKINSKIKIYIILEEKNVKLEKELINLKISKIFYTNQIEIKDMIKILKNECKSEEENLKEEIERLKELLLEKNINSQKDSVENFMKEQTKSKKNPMRTSKKEFKTICICGGYGVGKSIVSLLIAKYYEKQNKNVLVLDADIYNNSLHTMLGIRNSNEKFLKITKNINIFSSLNEFIDNERFLKNDRFSRFLKQIENEYDDLIIDTSSNMEDEYNRKILKSCNKIIFLVEPNLSEICKSKRIMDYYIQKLSINNKKINIIFNKVYKNSIDENILKNLFCDIKIIGKIKYSEKYAECINKNKINILEDKKLMKYCKIEENMRI